MITTTSSFSRTSARHYFYSVLRRSFGLTVFSFVCEFIFFPLQSILVAAGAIAKNKEPLSELRRSLFTGPGGIFTGVSEIFLLIILILLPVLYTLVQYAYLHRRQSTDLFHALPIERSRALLINYGASALMILAPLLVNFLITIIAALVLRVPQFSLPDTMLVLTTAIVAVLALLALCTLACVLSGTLFDAAVYSLGLIFFLPALLNVGYVILSQNLYGFDSFADHEAASLFSPASLLVYQNKFLDRSSFRFWDTRAQDFGHHRALLLLALAAWLVITAAVLTLAVRAYHRRKSELAGKTGYNNAITLLFKFSCAFAGGLLLSQLLGSAAESDSALLQVVGAALGGVLSYFLVECIMSRGFRTLRCSLPLAAAGLVLPAALSVIACTGGFGYETRVPNPEKVESVTLSFRDRYDFTRYDLNRIRSLQDAYRANHNSYGYSGDFEMQDVTLREDDAKALVQSLHQKAVGLRGDASGGLGFDLTYTMQNGSVLKRSYYGFGTADILEAYNRLGANEEVKHQTHPVFSFDAADVRSVTLMNRLMAGITPATLTEEQTQELIDAMRADLLAESFEQMQQGAPLGYVCLSRRMGFQPNARRFNLLTATLPEGDVAFEDCYVLVTDAYQNTIRLLSSYGYAGFDKIDLSKFDRAYASIRLRFTSERVFSLDGPDAFVPNTYQEQNYYTAYSFEADAGNDGYTKFTAQADVRALAENAVNEITQGMAPIRPEALAAFGEDYEDPQAAIVDVTFFTSDDSNDALTLHVNPMTLPESLLRQFRDSWVKRCELQWDDEKQVDSGELFDTMIDAVLESDGVFIDPQPGGGDNWRPVAAAGSIGVIG